MSDGCAIAIVKDIRNENVTDDDKALAIYQVMNMPTLMSVSKAELIIAIQWLWHQAYSFEEELVGEPDES